MPELLIVGATLFGFALVSDRLAFGPITAPMVFTSLGLLLGTAGLGWFDLRLESESATALVEATLVLVLFSDAVRIDLRALRAFAGLPVRLLGLGLPLTILLGTGIGALVLDDVPLAQVALLAAVVAPTDAALGQAVVSDRRLPVRIRQALNVESGLNDGIVVPIVTVLLAVATADAATQPAGWHGLVVSQLGFGVGAGLVAGLAGGRLLRAAVDRELVQGVWRQIGTLAVAVLAYAGAELLGGNGFIAAFAAGIAFGQVVGPTARDVPDFTEDEAELLTGTTFLVFGAVLAGPLLADVTWQIALYATLSLTVARMLPVLAAMVGSGTRVESRLFLGWFGPRGLASILFTLLVVEELAGAAPTVPTAATCTVLMSVYLHGLSAGPWSRRLARVLAAGVPHAVERGPALTMPTRRRIG